MLYKVDVFFDAACKNQPHQNCPMGIGVAVFLDNQYQEDLSRAILYENHTPDDGTSNIGEWLALCEALELVQGLRKDYQGKFNVFGDSKLVVNQFNQIWRIKEDKFLKYFQRASKANQLAKISAIQWVPREKNQQADDLSKMGLQLSNTTRYLIKLVHKKANYENIEYQGSDLDQVQHEYNEIKEVNPKLTYEVWDTKSQTQIYFS